MYDLECSEAVPICSVFSGSPQSSPACPSDKSNNSMIIKYW